MSNSSHLLWRSPPKRQRPKTPCCSRISRVSTNLHQTGASGYGLLYVTNLDANIWRQNELAGSGRNAGKAGEGEGVDSAFEVPQCEPVAIPRPRRSIRVACQ